MRVITRTQQSCTHIITRLHPTSKKRKMKRRRAHADASRTSMDAAAALEEHAHPKKRQMPAVQQRRASLPLIFVDEEACRSHNALLETRIYSQDTSSNTNIWDLPFRATALLERLHALECKPKPVVQVIRVHVEATAEDIERVTSRKYRQWLSRGCNENEFLDGDKTTLLTSTTLSCARFGAGCVLAAASHVFSRESTATCSPCLRAFALVRPPGHHNSCVDLIEKQFDIDTGTPGNFIWGCHGGCIYNNIAMAIRMLQNEDSLHQTLPPRRFAVIDIDAHFGDGTALQFWLDSNVLTISIHWSQHETGQMFPFLQGSPDETGGDDAEGTCLNIPLADGSDDASLLRATHNAILALQKFDPNGGIFVACGFDGLDEDLSSELCFTPKGYGDAVKALVEAFSNVPFLATLEGGYTTSRQASAFESVIQAL